MITVERFKAVLIVSSRRFVITYDHLHSDFNTKGIQLLSQPQRVGIDAIRRQHLRADSNNLGVDHAFWTARLVAALLPS